MGIQRRSLAVAGGPRERNVLSHLPREFCRRTGGLRRPRVDRGLRSCRATPLPRARRRVAPGRPDDVEGLCGIRIDRGKRTVPREGGIRAGADARRTEMTRMTMLTLTAAVIAAVGSLRVDSRQARPRDAALFAYTALF